MEKPGVPHHCGLDSLLGVAAPNATGVTNAQAKGTSQTSICHCAKKAINPDASGINYSLVLAFLQALAALLPLYGMCIIVVGCWPLFGMCDCNLCHLLHTMHGFLPNQAFSKTKKIKLPDHHVTM